VQARSSGKLCNLYLDFVTDTISSQDGGLGLLFVGGELKLESQLRIALSLQTLNSINLQFKALDKILYYQIHSLHAPSSQNAVHVAD
jgi:hypothetical protein